MSLSTPRWSHRARCARRGEAFGLRLSSGAFCGGALRQEPQRTAALQDAVAHPGLHASHRGGGLLSFQNSSFALAGSVPRIQNYSWKFRGAVAMVQNRFRKLGGVVRRIHNHFRKLGEVVRRIQKRFRKLGGVLFNVLTASRHFGISACMWPPAIPRLPSTHRL